MHSRLGDQSGTSALVLSHPTRPYNAKSEREVNEKGL
jgi:hypothetical protein